MCSPKLSQKGVRVYLIIFVFLALPQLNPCKTLRNICNLPMCISTSISNIGLFVSLSVCLSLSLSPSLSLSLSLSLSVSVSVSVCLCLRPGLCLCLRLCLCLSVCLCLSACQTQVWDTKCGSGTGPVQSRKDHTNQNEWDILVRGNKTCIYF